MKKLSSKQWIIQICEVRQDMKFFLLHSWHVKYYFSKIHVQNRIRTPPLPLPPLPPSINSNTWLNNLVNCTHNDAFFLLKICPTETSPFWILKLLLASSTWESLRFFHDFLSITNKKLTSGYSLTWYLVFLGLSWCLRSCKVRHKIMTRPSLQSIYVTIYIACNNHTKFI